MTFTTFTGTSATTIDTLANGLIASGYWTENDATLTTAGTPPARTIKYVYNATTEIYLTLVAGVWGRSGAYYSTEGILVFLSSSWDADNHVPSGTVKIMQMPFKNYSITWPSTYVNTSQIWMSYDSDTLAIMGQGTLSSYNDSVFLFTLERDIGKEYDDSQTNWFAYNTAQKHGYYDLSGANTGWGVAPYSWSLPSAWSSLKVTANGPFKFIHPWASAFPVARLEDSISNYYNNFEYDSGASFINRNACLSPMRARRSTGDSKVYMAFPIGFNDPLASWNVPIKALKAFFPVEPGQGLASGDLITIPLSYNGNNVTWKYIYLNVTSADSQQLDIAIKHSVVL